MPLHAGVARTRLTPPWGVELAGWGYYLSRTWRHIRDHTTAKALALENGGKAAVLIALDLMYLDAAYTQGVREQVARATGIPESSILVACTHSHNTPTAAVIRGAGELDPAYFEWAQRQAATAAILAWQQRKPALARVGKAEAPGWTFNRTRENGPVDTRLSVWRLDQADGQPLAAVVNFHAHPTVMMRAGNGPADLSRDYPGVIRYIMEHAIPGLTALYFQGSCGDVNFLPRWNEPDRCMEPGRFLAGKALDAFASARPVGDPEIGVCTQRVTLPTRRWTREEVRRDREEGLYRLRTGDTNGWRENIGRVMVNEPDRFPDRYGGDVGLAVKAIARFAVEWTEQILKDLETRPENLTTEVQAIRLGDTFLVANPSELFTTLALEVRRQWPHDDLMIVGYANDSIGYVPDSHDIVRQTYAANQSPKFKNQFPFVPESGDVMVRSMVEALALTRSENGASTSFASKTS